jgi:hypothetical protein
MCFWWIVLPIFHELKLRKFAGMVKYFVFQFVEVFEVPGCWGTSSSEFYKGLTEVITGKRLSDIKPITNDAILRYFECPNYELAILNNKTHMHQHFAFENSL